MARPKKQTVDYFPHYADASDRKTLTILQNKYGNDGYAFWFKLLQLLCKAPGHYLYISNEADWEFLVAKTHISDTEKAQKILDTLAMLDAIDKELYILHCIWSDNFVENLKDVYEKRVTPPPSKPIIDNGNLVFATNITTQTALSPQLSTEMAVSGSDNPQSKVNKSKVNKTKLIDNISTNNKKPYGDFMNILLSDEEYQKLTLKFGKQGCEDKISKLSIGIESKGYKYKSHYATILSWERMDNKGGRDGAHKQDTKPIKPTGIRIIS